MYASLVNSVNYGYSVNYIGKHLLSLSCWCTSKSLIIKTRFLCTNPKSPVPPWKVLFFGTDDFSVISLKKLTEEKECGNLIKQLEVVTSIKPKANVVQKYAEKKMLKVHNWPPVVANAEFDFGIVVSFGHLIPKTIISMFPLGMFNVHASLLPRWRGAAPIVYALMNGDTETGVTIMQIKPHKFDVGGILKQATFPLSLEATFPVVRDALAHLGSEILLESLKHMPFCLEKIKEQTEDGVTYAPRVSPSLALVDWNKMSALQIYNLWRALVGIHPLISKWHGITIKIFSVELHQSDIAMESVDQFLNSVQPGYVYYHRPSKLLRVKCSDGNWISVANIGLPAKKPMSCKDFYNGYISKVQLKDRYFV
ncbi:Uncharacterized protein GBIM_00527 [Gryllus bimaculatus]|nr:Uncharacterized protein GBIM_00527 [Gryllus bimaculatus]